MAGAKLRTQEYRPAGRRLQRVFTQGEGVGSLWRNTTPDNGQALLAKDSRPRFVTFIERLVLAVIRALVLRF
jgi:hypothetical protein